MHTGAVGRLIEACIAVDARLTVGKCLIFGNKTDYIHAEAVHSFVQPPVHHIKYFFSHFRVVPVQIRLLSGKKMEIIHVCRGIVLPRGTGEAGSPVVRLSSVFGRTPDIVIPVRIIF